MYKYNDNTLCMYSRYSSYIHNECFDKESTLNHVLLQVSVMLKQ